MAHFRIGQTRGAPSEQFKAPSATRRCPAAGHPGTPNLDVLETRQARWRYHGDDDPLVILLGYMYGYNMVIIIWL